MGLLARRLYRNPYNSGAQIEQNSSEESSPGLISEEEEETTGGEAKPNGTQKSLSHTETEVSE